MHINILHIFFATNCGYYVLTTADERMIKTNVTHDTLFGFLLTLARQTSRPDFTPAKVTIGRTPARSTERLREFVAAPIEFGAPASAMVFSKEDLQASLRARVKINLRLCVSRRPHGAGQRKSVEPMAARVQPERVRSAHQSMHHLVAEANWSNEAMLSSVARTVLPKLIHDDEPVNWIVDDTDLPKKGKRKQSPIATRRGTGIVVLLFQE